MYASEPTCVCVHVCMYVPQKTKKQAGGAHEFVGHESLLCKIRSISLAGTTPHRNVIRPPPDQGFFRSVPAPHRPRPKRLPPLNQLARALSTHPLLCSLALLPPSLSFSPSLSLSIERELYKEFEDF